MREDRFIEHTAGLLGADIPVPLVDFVWDPIKDSSDPWVCPLIASGCYASREDDDLSVVVSNTLSNHLELVHAIDVQAFGQAHQTLQEGLAEYLGSFNLTSPRADFAGAFKAMLAASPRPSKYDLAMHFVGSIFEQHGLAKYQELRAKLPTNAGLDEFAAVFEAVYEQPLDDALEAMTGQQIRGIDTLTGCDGEAPVLPWTSEGSLDVEIESACGDPWFFGGGFAEGPAGFYGYYAVEVTEAGLYELTIEVAEEQTSRLSGMAGCSFDLPSLVASRGGQPGQGQLQSGRHFLAIAFPPRPEARGEARVKLVRIGPPP